jgi:vitamin B12 transporter
MALLSAPALFAQSSPAITDTLQLDDIIITGTKIPVSLRETTRPVVIINRNEIEQSTARDFSQLLNSQSGIRVNNSQGTPSGNQSLFMQGAGGEYSLILIDGMAVKDPSGVGGAIDLRLLPLNNIERIEILKGNQSALYGSEALAGVINIITKNGSANLIQTEGQISYGAFNTFKGTLGLNGSLSDRLMYYVSYNHESGDGISAAADPSGTGTFENDGFQHNSFYGKLTIQPTERLSITPFIHVTSFDGDFDADAFTDAQNTFTLNMFNPGALMLFESGDVRISGNYGYTYTDRLFLSQFGEFTYEGKFHNGDVFGSYGLSRFITILAGVNVQTGMLPATFVTEEVSASFASPYTTLLVRNIRGLSIEAGYRLNNHSEYGSNSTFSLSPSYTINDWLKLHASFGSGFKAPTLNELFGPFGPNPNLDPESSSELRFGAESYFIRRSLKLEAHYFRRDIKNLIVYTFDPGYINRDREKTNGFELAMNWIVSPAFTFGAHYNYLSGKTITLDGTGNRVSADGLIRKPKHLAGFYGSYRFGKGLFLQLDGEFVGDRTDLFFNPENHFSPEDVILDSYFLLNGYVEFSFFDQSLSLFASIRNLLNMDFTEVYGFDTMRLHANTGLRFRF